MRSCEGRVRDRKSPIADLRWGQALLARWVRPDELPAGTAAVPGACYTKTLKG